MAYVKLAAYHVPVWMYTNAGQTLYFCYTVKELGILPTCIQLYLLASSGLI